MKEVTTSLLLAVLISITRCSSASSPACKDFEEQISYLNGERALPAREMTITICNTTAVTQGQPITLESYQEYLKLYNNRNLVKIYANTFSQLPNVKTLIISNVGLSVFEQDAFKGLQNLLYLNAQKNRIQNLPAHVFDDTPNLVELDLEENSLETIDVHQFEKLNNLKKLKLAKNELTDLPDHWPDHWTNGLHNLEYLTLSNNEIAVLKNGMFQGLRKLETLRINNNQITKLEAGCFSGLTSLKSLSLHYNGVLQSEYLLSELRSLQSLSGLTISPPNLECGIMQLLTDWSNEKSVEIVQIPSVASCWQK